jgi:hypothetical protein
VGDSVLMCVLIVELQFWGHHASSYDEQGFQSW